MRAVLGLVVTLTLCACRPAIIVTNDGIKDLDALDKVMGVLADAADPGFDIADGAADGQLTEPQLKQLAAIGGRVTLAANRAKGFSKGAGYDALADQLASQGRALTKAAQASDGAAAVKGATAIRDTCRACHSEFR